MCRSKKSYGGLFFPKKKTLPLQKKVGFRTINKLTGCDANRPNLEIFEYRDDVVRREPGLSTSIILIRRYVHNIKILKGFVEIEFGTL